MRKGPKLAPQHSESRASQETCWTPYSNTLLRRVVGIRPQTSASQIIATTSWQPGPRTREAPTVSPKSLLISGAKNEQVLLPKWQKDQQIWKHFPSTLPNLNGAKVQLFQASIVSYSHFRKLHLCTLVFLCLFFRRKITETDRAVIPSEVVRLEPYPPQFLKFGHVPPHPPNNDWENKIMILCSICTLIFVSGGRALLLPVIQKGLFLGPKKSRKIRHANTDLPSSGPSLTWSPPWSPLKLSWSFPLSPPSSLLLSRLLSSLETSPWSLPLKPPLEVSPCRLPLKFF